MNVDGSGSLVFKGGGTGAALAVVAGGAGGLALVLVGAAVATASITTMIGHRKVAMMEMRARGVIVSATFRNIQRPQAAASRLVRAASSLCTVVNNARRSTGNFQPILAQSKLMKPESDDKASILPFQTQSHLHPFVAVTKEYPTIFVAQSTTRRISQNRAQYGLLCAE